jgi:Trk-type K+ transport system membrane component
MPFSGNMVPYVEDPVVCLTMTFLIMAGNVAFPLFFRLCVWVAYRVTRETSWKYLLKWVIFFSFALPSCVEKRQGRLFSFKANWPLPHRRCQEAGYHSRYIAHQCLALAWSRSPVVASLRRLFLTSVPLLFLSFFSDLCLPLLNVSSGLQVPPQVLHAHVHPGRDGWARGRAVRLDTPAVVG